MADAKPAIRLDPADEFMHQNTGEENFNESMYFNFFATDGSRGGFLRIGNRPNEGYAETTVCLYEPEGRVLFHFDRPKIPGNDSFEAGGVRFEVEKPFEALRVRYQGTACSLDDPLSMIDPRKAFTSNPFVPVGVDLRIRGIGPMFGGERSEPRSDHEMEFARGHYEQHHEAVGRLEIEGASFEIRGFGLRDHSWGPRSWQAPASYRWLTANFGPDFGFMGSQVVSRDGSEIRGGFLHRGRELVGVRHLELETDFVGEQQVHDRIRARLECSDGRQVEVEGRVLSLIPLRNRRRGRTTRISEGMTEWRCEGRTGYGISEYLDQLD